MSDALEFAFGRKLVGYDVNNPGHKTVEWDENHTGEREYYLTRIKDKTSFKLDEKTAQQFARFIQQR